ncbi:Protein LHY [Platanthera guangdongensis]|uniref:Protein LHY n=1 Tax=Platanthera guangdongensis TaxID=2320717 RepID=A0ABR2LS41_9ASPA
MEMNSAGEDLSVKTRKPYTITRQRERWSEEEHSKFLVALKLYGRAWQRIEVHIGTKTAVQIRSHAQKFFAKVEKESVAKGTPMGKSHEIDIPPPRPKRKPKSPYPRKLGASSVLSTAKTVDEKATKFHSQETIKDDLTLERNAQIELSAATISLQGIDVCSDRGNCSVVLNLFQETPSVSVAPCYKGSTDPLTFKEFASKVIEPNEAASGGETSLSFEVDVEPSTNGKNLGKINEISKDLHTLQKSPLLLQNQNGIHKEAWNHNVQVENCVQSSCTDICNSKVTAESLQFPCSTSPFMNNTTPAVPGLETSLAMSSIPPPSVNFPPFAQFHSTQDFGTSFLNISSTFSSLIISTLLQNPAVHMAASMAASLWPSGEVDSLTDSSMAGAAAATVAAAASWWSTHGLLPLFPPIHTPGLSFPLQSNAQFPHDKMEEKDGANQISLRTRDLKAQPSPSKSALSSSDSEEIENDASNVNNIKPASGATANHNSDKGKIAEKTERSSCGSNTPSSSEVETDAALKTEGETNGEAQQVHSQILPLGEVNARRSRSGGSINDSWKEVSQEGRVAFQALFARDILPQTFLRRHAEIEMGFPKDLPTGQETESTKKKPDMTIQKTGKPDSNLTRGVLQR